MINAFAHPPFVNLVNPHIMNCSAQFALNGRRVLIVLGSYEGKLPIYQQMHHWGIKMVVVDGAGHWAQNYVETGLFEAFIEIDQANPDLEDILYAIQSLGLRYDAVITFDDYAKCLTAQVSRALGCIGHQVEAVNLNKFEVRRCCEAAGLPSPRFALIEQQGDLLGAAHHVGFPAVIKPVCGASSCDVFCVTSYDDLLTRYQVIMQQQSKCYEDHLNSGVSDEGRLTWQHGFTMVLEEYIDGDEYDIDCLLSYGEMVYASVTEEKPQPKMIETGARLPATCPSHQEAELIQMAQDVLQILGYTDGVFHVEAKYTTKGVRLIEVNPRMGGGPIYQMNKLVWGVDLVEQYLLTTLGCRIQPMKPAPKTYLSSIILVAPFSGTVTRDDFLDHLKNDPDVVFCKTYATAGAQVDGPEHRVPGWLGEIIVQGKSRKAADQRLEEIVTDLHIPLEPISTKLPQSSLILLDQSNLKE